MKNACKKEVSDKRRTRRQSFRANIKEAIKQAKEGKTKFKDLSRYKKFINESDRTCMCKD